MEEKKTGALGLQEFWVAQQKVFQKICVEKSDAAGTHFPRDSQRPGVVAAQVLFEGRANQYSPGELQMMVAVDLHIPAEAEVLFSPHNSDHLKLSQ